jgi:large subunit ribosomal protein L24
MARTKAQGKAPKLHVKKGDTVVVVSGKDKGATGKVIAAFPRQRRVLVEGVNLVKKHTKIGQTTRGAKTGGIITQEAPIHASNVMPVVEAEGSKTGTRVGSRVEDDGRRVRVARKTGEDL